MAGQQLVDREVASLRPYVRNARTHSKKQVKQIAASIERFGFTNPVLVSDRPKPDFGPPFTGATCWLRIGKSASRN